MKQLFIVLLFAASTLFAKQELVTKKLVTQKLADYPVMASGIALFDAWMQSQVQHEQIPQALVGIVYKDTLIWSKAYGNILLDAPIPIGSLTKPLTATAIMRLWQEGRIDLDVPIDRYLPTLKVQEYNPKIRPITVRQLLNHSSGLAQDPDFAYYNDRVFPSFHEIWQRMPKLEMVYQPGEHWKYSNLGYALLGKVIETVTNDSYEEYVKKELFLPLGMRYAAFRLTEEELKNVPRGNEQKVAGKRSEILPYLTHGMNASMGLFTKLEDAAKLTSFFLGKVAQKSIISPETRRYMLTSTIPMANNIRWGLGVGIRQLDDLLLIEHASMLPGYSAYMSVDPFQQCGLILFCTSPHELTHWANMFVRWVSSSISDELHGKTAKTKPPALWQKYLGRYEGPFGEVYVLMYKGALVLYEPYFANNVDILKPQSKDGHFRVEGGFTYNGTDGDQVVFSLNSEGIVEWMKLANIYLYPVSK